MAKHQAGSATTVSGRKLASWIETHLQPDLTTCHQSYSNDSLEEGFKIRTPRDLDEYLAQETD